MLPHNLTMTVTGASLLWVGWFGFNAGSALAANGSAGMAMLVTHMAAAAGSLAWMGLEWAKFGKPSVLGIVTGMVAGLGTITPASGFVGPMGALVIGLAAGVICFFATQTVKRKLKIDDSLDVFPVHGVGGFTGLLLTAVFSADLARRPRLARRRVDGAAAAHAADRRGRDGRLVRRRDVRDPQGRERDRAAARLGRAGERGTRPRARTTSGGTASRPTRCSRPSGSLRRTSKPPSARFRASTAPPCNSITRAVIARPMPWPPCAWSRLLSVR